MKIVLFGMGYYNYTHSFKYALEKLGHSVLTIVNEHYKPNSKNFLIKKKEMIEYNSDIFINFCGNYDYNLIDSNFLKQISGKKVLIFADAVKFVGNVEQNYKLYDKVVVFEPKDVNYLKEKYGINAALSEVCVDTTIYCNDDLLTEKKYDLSFVGVFTKERGNFFEEIAKYAYDRNLKMVWYGRFWREKYWWQKLFGRKKFALKYPYISKFCRNIPIGPEDVAVLYKQSKICLNKHVARHEGMGYRVFEIMGSNNFQLCDKRIQAENYGLSNGSNIVFYESAKDCVNKIEYYLKNDELREKIARKGTELVRDRYTSEKVMQRLIDSL